MKIDKDITNESVEAAARALYLHEHGTYIFAKEAWAKGTEHNDKWRERARVVLEAARDATKEHIKISNATVTVKIDLKAAAKQLRDAADKLDPPQVSTEPNPVSKAG